MNEKIKEVIFEENFKMYDHEAFRSEDLVGFIAELDEEVELALDCYNRLDEEDVPREIVQRAWDLYDKVRQYNRPVINAIKAVLRKRGDK